MVDLHHLVKHNFGSISRHSETFLVHSIEWTLTDSHLSVQEILAALKETCPPSSMITLYITAT